MVASLLYFGYMLLISFAFFLSTGAIGFAATLMFVRKIYASIKVD
jgi:transmembrane 9 superfamily protein 2/4